MIANDSLSATNHLATDLQRRIEAQALEIMQTPVMIKARERATQRLLWLCEDRIPEERKHRLDVTMEEWTLHYILMALNSDSSHPKVVNNYFEPEHEWFGMKVPGNRTFGGENWDNTYTIIPLDPYSRFVLYGQRINAGVADVSFSVMGNIGVAMTLDSIAQQELDINEDGSFVITIGPQPATRTNGRRNNHLQTKPDACFLLIRNTRSDWRQIPNIYRIERLDPVLAPPMTLEQIVDKAARHTVEDVPPNHWFMVTPTHPPVNEVPQPFNTGAIGGLVSQGITQGNLRIADDEAFVITLSSGGAKYQVFTLYDFWLCKMDWRKTTSLNNAQSAPNPDGSFTYVISHQDPGIHNWIDTEGVHEPRIMNRWHALPANPAPDQKLWLKGELVKLKDLDRVLPEHIRRVTPAERQQQLAERAETFLLRYVDY